MASTLAPMGVTCISNYFTQISNSCFSKLRLSQVDGQISLCCSDQEELYKTTSSRYASHPDIPYSIRFTIRWKVAGALWTPKGITVYCRKASGVTNADHSFAQAVKGTCQYPLTVTSNCPTLVITYYWLLHLHLESLNYIVC